MKVVDMSSRAISLRLQRTSQLRTLCLKLGKAKKPAGSPAIVREQIRADAYDVEGRPDAK